jgi:hypothetical protein
VHVANQVLFALNVNDQGVGLISFALSVELSSLIWVAVNCRLTILKVCQRTEALFVLGATRMSAECYQRMFQPKKSIVCAGFAINHLVFAALRSHPKA